MTLCTVPYLQGKRFFLCDAVFAEIARPTRSHQRLLVEADRLCYELELDPMKVYEAECGFHGFRSTTSSFDPTKYKHLYAKVLQSSPLSILVYYDDFGSGWKCPFAHCSTQTAAQLR